MSDSIDRELLASLVEQINIKLGDIMQDVCNVERRAGRLEEAVKALREENAALRMKIDELEN